MASLLMAALSIVLILALSGCCTTPAATAAGDDPAILRLKPTKPITPYFR